METTLPAAIQNLGVKDVQNYLSSQMQQVALRIGRLQRGQAFNSRMGIAPNVAVQQQLDQLNEEYAQLAGLSEAANGLVEVASATPAPAAILPAQPIESTTKTP